MALTYDGASGIFTHLGALIARVNSLQVIPQTTLPADLAAIIAAFGSTWKPGEGITSLYAGLQGDVTSWRKKITEYCDRRVRDNDTVLSQLSLASSSGLDQVLPALCRQMGLDSKTVKASVATIGSVTAAAGNAGNGTAYVTPILDGYNAPVSGGRVYEHYPGLTTQLTVPSETMTLECKADSVRDNTREGGESWSITGKPKQQDMAWEPEGSGSGPSLSTVNESGNLLTNGGLETWSSNVPTGWTLALGTAGTDTFQETGAANVYRGSSSLKIVGGGAATTQLKQSRPGMTGKRRYHVSLAFKASATAAGATVKAYLGGTGFTPTEVLTISGAAFPTSWTLYGAFCSTPGPIPSDWYIALEANTLAAGKTVYIDSVAPAPVVYHGGVGVVVQAGAVRWQRGDRLSFTLTNNQAGKFQDFARRHWLLQLPSAGGGAETISDALVA